MASSNARFTSHSAVKGLDAADILDEAVSLLRRAPLSIVSIYFLGAFPFCLGLVYFWSDMAQSANAETRLPGEALGLAVLYFWMKTCQAVFSRKLLTLMEGDDLEPWTLARWLHTAVLQVIYAGTLFLVYPVALLITIPFAWVNAFYHNISIVATSSKSTLGSSFREAGDLARLWPKQSFLILGILVLAFFVLFINLAVFCISIPQLMNSLLGIETVFSENLYAWNNSSFYLNISVLCFLLLNPLNKAVFVLRCFHGRARLSGADLRAELRRQQLTVPGIKSSRTAGVLALILLLAWSSHSAQAQPPTPEPAPTPTVSTPQASDLDRAIQKTLEKEEFAWRLPRHESVDAGEEGFLGKLMDRLAVYFKKLGHHLGRAIERFIKWLFDSKKEHGPPNGISALASIPWRVILIALAILVCGVLVFGVLLRFRQRRNRAAMVELKPAAVRTVDLEAENVQADELPEDAWLALAQQLLERGELRLALRAFYLATLSSLARQQLVRLAVGKSNRDYVQELARRLRGETPILPRFRENVRLFEASWYGTHAVTDAVIDSMRNNQQQMQGHAAT